MKKMFFIIIIVLFCLFLYAYYIEPNKTTTNEYSIHNTNIPEGFQGFKIVQFSDILYDNNLKLINKIVKDINKEKPDIIVFNGDLLKEKITNSDKKELISSLSKLESNFNKYAVLGEHDTETSIEILEESGFKILDNTSEYIFNDDDMPIIITGGKNITKESYQTEIDSKFVIALIHKPDDYDNIEYKDNSYTLVLAGHSLGGEINIPFYGSLLNKNGATKYTKKHYNSDNKSLYINFGTGLGKSKMRLFNKPSINIYRLYSK